MVEMCPALKTPDNGQMLNTRVSHHFGDEVIFLCRIGYIMVGASSLQCTAAGTWNASVPGCQPAQCVSLADDQSEGLTVARSGPADSLLVPYGQNIPFACNEPGRLLIRTPTASFRQCVYDPRAGFPQYWFSGAQPSCPRIDRGKPPETPGAEYGFFPDTRYKSSFFFGCQPTFTLTGQSSRNDNVVRCMENGVWDFGDLRCEGPLL
jgi:hypothetical protein